MLKGNVTQLQMESVHESLPDAARVVVKIIPCKITALRIGLHIEFHGVWIQGCLLLVIFRSTYFVSDQQKPVACN
jgi:hypothetical protein